jgi:hypothetical protein
MGEVGGRAGDVQIDSGGVHGFPDGGATDVVGDGHVGLRRPLGC